MFLCLGWYLHTFQLQNEVPTLIKITLKVKFICKPIKFTAELRLVMSRIKYFNFLICSNLFHFDSDI